MFIARITKHLNILIIELCEQSSYMIFFPSNDTLRIYKSSNTCFSCDTLTNNSQHELWKWYNCHTTNQSRPNRVMAQLNLSKTFVKLIAFSHAVFFGCEYSNHVDYYISNVVDYRSDQRMQEDDDVRIYIYIYSTEFACYVTHEQSNDHLDIATGCRVTYTSFRRRCTLFV